jgi:HK97 family phage portal protein
MSKTISWGDVQRRAAVQGSPILTNWRAEREASRLVNSAQYSTEVMESFGVAPSGTTVSATSAMRVAAVAACVQKIAGTISTLRLDSFVIDGDSEVRQPRDEMWYMLNEQPSDLCTATSHWEGATSSQLMRGDGYTWIRRRMNGTVRELLPLPWGGVTPIRDMRDHSVRYYINLPELGITTWVDPSDILHFHGHCFDAMRMRSISVIQHAARNAIGNALAMDEYSGKFFEGGAHPSIILNSASKMSSQQITDLQLAFARKYAGLANAHKLPLVLTEGITAKEISLSAEDAQLLEARKFQVTDIARAFGVPPHMIGETTGSSAVGAGYEQQARDFVMHTLRLHIKRMEQELNRKLYPRSPNKFVRFDLEDLIEGDSKAQAEYNRAALGGPGTGPGWMSVDEVRRKKGLAPKGGDAAKIFDPRAITTAQPTNQPPQPDAKAAP